MTDAFAAKPSITRATALAVACSLSAATSAALGLLDVLMHGEYFSGLISGITTWVAGYVWIRRALRSKHALPHRFTVGVGMLNAAAAAGILAAVQSQAGTGDVAFVGGLFVGAVAGAMVWGPALLLTQLFLGGPLARAKRHAARGLAGAEDGERLLAKACLVLATLALVATPRLWGLGGAESWIGQAGVWFMHLDALAGLALALAVIGWTRSAERERRAVVVRAEQGVHESLRVHAEGERRVLVRVTAAGEGYREALLEEEVAELDETGRVGRVRSIE